MQRLKYLLIALGFAAATVSAQPEGPRPGGPFDIERLAVLLDLDAYQKGEVQRVFTEQREVMRAARAEIGAGDERPSREEMQARRTAHQAALVTKLSAVLTEPQMTKFKVLTERPARGEGRRGRHGDQN